MHWSPRLRWSLRGLLVLSLLVLAVAHWRYEVLPKRVRVIEPGRLVRGAWQRPIPLQQVVRDQKIETVVTLTAINPTDPKYIRQKRVVDQTGIDWIIVPMRGSRATIEQLAQAADLLADPARQPVFFHCVAGHHRTNLTHAAYRIRHDGWSVEAAWQELRQLPWTRPEDVRDDRSLLEAFARQQNQIPKLSLARGLDHVQGKDAQTMDRRHSASDRRDSGRFRGLAVGYR